MTLLESFDNVRNETTGIPVTFERHKEWKRFVSELKIIENFSKMRHYTSCNYRQNYFYQFIPLVMWFSIIKAFKPNPKMKFSKLYTIIVVIIVKIIFISSFLL